MAITLADLTASITSALANLPPQNEIQEPERFQVLGALAQLQEALQPPILGLHKLLFGHQALTTIGIAQGMGIFDTFAENEGSALTIDELKKKTKGDEQLLVRIMHSLASNGVFKEVDKETFQAKPLAPFLVTGTPTGQFVRHVRGCMRVNARLYDYFEANDFKYPVDAYDSPFQFAYETNDHYFEWLKKNPADQEAFNATMTLGRQFRGVEWFEYFPVEKKLQDTAPDRAVFIDIGGGIGHDITELKNRFPQLPGRFILQDLPDVIDNIPEPLSNEIEAVTYDMFTSQPVPLAKVYYMRTVLHDWPDKQALQALARIHDAMADDSLLLINENTYPETNVPYHSACVDITMMEMFSSLERTEKQWIALLEQARFRVVGVWKPKQHFTGSNALFEAVRA
ncbi:Demethylsterigmatocystin 6-O-methyltransferase [Talaromyces pinophilus]|nr:Demethylsterigmatocystin 6-O-methyltransferase [Talaromyces pinophilus]